MEESKFEKQVKRKMDELKLQPSEELWEKIANRIEKKKRSRWGFILLILLCCIILSGGYWLWNTGPQRVAENNSPLKNNLEKNIDNKLKEKRNDGNESKTTPVLSSVNKNDANAGEDERINSNKKFMQHHQFPTSSTTKLLIKSTTGPTVAISEKQDTVTTIHEENGMEKDLTKSQNIERNESGINEPKDYLNDKITANTLSDSLLKNSEVKLKEASTQKNSVTKTNEKFIRNRWKTGILFSGGLSNVGNGFSDINNSSFYLYDPAPNNSTSGGSSQGRSYYASNSVGSFGFIAGVFEEKSITPKTKISFGVNFTSFTTTSKIGKINDTTGFYNSQNPVSNFTAHYDFIELPVTLTIQIGKGKNIPFFWQGGLSVAELLHTNALQFNPGTGYYYRDNSIFNKTQVGLHTSLSIELFSKQKHSILVGPNVSYGATRIANDGLYNKKHFVYTGVRAAIIFGK